jgi:hypothetical protein
MDIYSELMSLSKCFTMLDASLNHFFLYFFKTLIYHYIWDDGIIFQTMLQFLVSVQPLYLAEDILNWASPTAVCHVEDESYPVLLAVGRHFLTVM